MPNVAAHLKYSLPEAKKVHTADLGGWSAHRNGYSIYMYTQYTASHCNYVIKCVFETGDLYIGAHHRRGNNDI